MGERWSYRHRPAKNIERHFIVDVCRIFAAFTREAFQYVGFGAIEFVDFELMHRALNIKRMISIESRDVARPAFNRPYKTIQILPGHTSKVLASGDLDLAKPSIVWFDYLKPLRQSEISDLIEVSRRIAAPSLFFFTVNARPDPVGTRLQTFIDNVGEDHVPPGTTADSLAKAGLGRAQQVVANAVIERAVKERKDEVEWFQVFNTHYEDEARMQTIGGIFMPRGSSQKEIDAIFAGLECYRPGVDFLDLRVPVITVRERALLDRQLPKAAGTPLRLPSVDESELVAYRNVYRYMHLAGLQSAAETTWTP